MIASLTGIIHRHMPGEVTVDVHGVGYRVSTPTEVWEKLESGKEAQLHICTYVREDRLDLYGFADRNGLILFESFIDMQGVGPRTALELCNVPRSLLVQAVTEEDPTILMHIKGIGKKTAEKLLVDLTSLAEKHPSLFSIVGQPSKVANQYDNDAIEALRTLGYDTSTIMKVLQNLPADLASTEERVSHALRAL